jgi:ArsR family transcriptional regulator
MSLDRDVRSPRLDGARAAHLAEVLKALAHPLRLRIVARLCHGRAHVTSLVETLGASQPLVSQQLRILRAQGLVAAARQDGFAWYGLAEPALRDLVCCMEKCRRRPAGPAREGAR